jgi:hypothetical protein
MSYSKEEETKTTNPKETDRVITRMGRILEERGIR